MHPTPAHWCDSTAPDGRGWPGPPDPDSPTPVRRRRDIVADHVHRPWSSHRTKTELGGTTRLSATSPKRHTDGPVESSAPIRGTSPTEVANLGDRDGWDRG